MSVAMDKTKERIMRIYGNSNNQNNQESSKISKLKPDKESAADPSNHKQHQKMIDFIKASAQLRSEINKTDDPMKALDLSLQCVSIYLDDNGFFYRNNKSRLIGG